MPVALIFSSNAEPAGRVAEYAHVQRASSFTEKPRAGSSSHGGDAEVARIISAPPCPCLKKEEAELTIRRVFQALRIAVNDEFSALETFLRHCPPVSIPADASRC